MRTSPMVAPCDSSMEGESDVGEVKASKLSCAVSLARACVQNDAHGMASTTAAKRLGPVRLIVTAGATLECRSYHDAGAIGLGGGDRPAGSMT